MTITDQRLTSFELTSQSRTLIDELDRLLGRDRFEAAMARPKIAKGLDALSEAIASSDEYSVVFLPPQGKPMQQTEALLQDALQQGANRVVLILSLVRGDSRGVKRWIDQMMARLQAPGSPSSPLERLKKRIPTEAEMQAVLDRARFRQQVSHILHRSGFCQTLLIQAAPAPLAPCTLYQQGQLSGDWLTLDGRRYRVLRGQWSFYVPDLSMKILYSYGGRMSCYDEAAPDRETVLASSGDSSDTVRQWQVAYRKSTIRRTAEAYVVASRLAAQGMGPHCRGLVLIRSLTIDGEPKHGVTGGMKLDDLRTYPVKPPTTAEQLAEAGVSLEAGSKSLDRQIRGYVSALNGGAGLMPRLGHGEVHRTENHLLTQLAGIQAGSMAPTWMVERER